MLECSHIQALLHCLFHIRSFTLRENQTLMSFIRVLTSDCAMLFNVTDGHLFLQPQLQLQEEHKLSQLKQDCKWHLREAVHTLCGEIN